MERISTTINKAKFLDHLIITQGNVKKAAENSNLSDSQFYKWLHDDEAYKGEYIEILKKIGSYCINVEMGKLLKRNSKAVRKQLRRVVYKLDYLDESIF